MKIKVCGMKYPNNIKELVGLPIDMMGLIFYEKSPRYAGNLSPCELRIVPPHIQKVGVFVNASGEDIFTKIREYDLQIVQLHGDESPCFCRNIKNQGIKIIKSFPIETNADFEQCNSYENAGDYFLFDTKTPAYGGSGKKFDWKILASYSGKTPFILSGGIAPEDVAAVLEIQHPKLYGIDLNSRFETVPGEKDIEKLRQFFAFLYKSQKQSELYYLRTAKELHF
ncbi:MAG: phosphoribosylanthranilate isomerase [Dysgonamonadaceae bacterium]|jgi:phosphoribosylanthranilate isomerase|nr:phosphoribosylanthranilate isomerase [Dysgonamonadaceae bacterium]